jgi:hypothetical protein
MKLTLEPKKKRGKQIAVCGLTNRRKRRQIFGKAKNLKLGEKRLK